MGTFLIGMWILGLTFCWLTTSFDVWNLAFAPALHALLSLVGVVRLKVLHRKKKIEGAKMWVAAICYVLTLLLLGGLLYGSTQLLVRPIVVRSGSMMPAIATGDTVIAQLFAPRLFGVDFGDIVLFMHPTESGQMLIKRILGMEGDLIEVRGGELFRNGRRLAQCRLRPLRDPEKNKRVVERLEVVNERPYLVWDQPAFISKAVRVRVPRGHVFVAGDNRDRSGDSRSFGAVPVSLIKARVRVRLFPIPSNEIDSAPLGARKAAYERCRKGRGRHRAEGRNDE